MECSTQILFGCKHCKKCFVSEYEEAMLTHGVPSYYINSCKKIKYMFPKGHAVAYVTMAIRVGYFKVHYPLEFYATFFSVRSKQYDIIPMIKGEEAIINRPIELDGDRVTKKLTPRVDKALGQRAYYSRRGN